MEIKKFTIGTSIEHREVIASKMKELGITPINIIRGGRNHDKIHFVCMTSEETIDTFDDLMENSEDDCPYIITYEESLNLRV